MADAGISTLGVLFGYNSEKTGTYTQLTRINTISGISLETENIDASALEDYITRYVKCRKDTGGSWTVTINMTTDTLAEWKTVIETANKESIYFAITSPYITTASFVVKAFPPETLPMPEFNQNELQTLELSLVIDSYEGMVDGVQVKATEG